MVASYTADGRITKQGTNDNPNTWGTVLNNQVIELFEEMIAGVTEVDLTGSSDVTLTTNNGSTDEARHAVLELTGVLGADIDLLLPAVDKIYMIRADYSGAYTVTAKISGSSTSIDIEDGDVKIVYINGTDIYDMNPTAAAPLPQVKITASDTTSKYLQSALVAGSGITITLQNAGVNENLLISANVGVETGDTVASYRNAKTGWVLCDSKTIGSALSNATSRANDDTEDLFALLWALDSTLFPIYTSGGTLSTRGANAAADFAANKAIATPDERGRTSVGRDDMGGVAASRMTTAGSGVDGTKLGAVGGTETHVLTVAELAEHYHVEGEPAEDHNATWLNGKTTSTSQSIRSTFNAATSSTYINTEVAGEDEAHQNTQPSIVKNIFIKL